MRCCRAIIYNLCSYREETPVSKETGDHFARFFNQRRFYSLSPKGLNDCVDLALKTIGNFGILRISDAIGHGDWKYFPICPIVKYLSDSSFLLLFKDTDLLELFEIDMCAGATGPALVGPT